MCLFVVYYLLRVLI